MGKTDHALSNAAQQHVFDKAVTVRWHHNHIGGDMLREFGDFMSGIADRSVYLDDGVLRIWKSFTKT